MSELPRRGPVRLARAVYSRLLRLFPPPFVAVYGEDMTATFAAQLDRAGQGSSRDLAVFCGRTSLDLVVSIVLARLRDRGLLERMARGVSRGLQTAAQPMGVWLCAVSLGVSAAIVPAAYLGGVAPLALPEPSRLVRLGEVAPAIATDYVSPLTFDDWVEAGADVATLAAIRHWTDVPFDAGGDGAVTVTHVTATPNVFEVLGIQPLLGRTFAAEQRSVASETVIAHDTWVRHFGRDPRVIGRHVRLRGVETTVVGVLPPVPLGADHGWGDVFTCLYRYDPRRQRAEGFGARYLTVIGRLHDGIDLDEARRRMAALQRRLWTTPGSVAAGYDVRVEPLRAMAEAPRTALVAGAAAAQAACLAALGLLLMCVVTARSTAGPGPPSRWRVSAVSSLLAAAAFAGSTSLVRDGLPSAQPLAVPPAWAMGAVAAVLAALLPLAIRAIQRSGAMRGAIGGRYGSAVRRTVAALEVALATVLLVCTGLVGRSVANLERVDPGFEPRRAWSFDLFLPTSRYDGDGSRRFVRALLHDLASAPGAAAVGALTYPPHRSKVWQTPIWGRSDTNDAAGAAESQALLNVLAGDALAALGAQIVAGRAMTAEESHAVSRVAMINQSLAARLFPADGAVGRLVRVETTGPWYEVVGVVADMRQHGPDVAAQPEVFLPYGAEPLPFLTVVVRSAAARADVARLVQAGLDRLDPTLGRVDVEALGAVPPAGLADRRFVFVFLCALCLVVVPAVAVTVFDDIAGTPRFGAPWARTLARDAWTSVVALALGLTAAGAAMGAVPTLLFDVAPLDVTTYAAAAAILLGVVVAMAMLARTAVAAEAGAPHQA